MNNQQEQWTKPALPAKLADSGDAHRNHKYDFEVGMIQNTDDSLHVLTESSTPHITVFVKRIGTRLVWGGAASAILKSA